MTDVEDFTLFNDCMISAIDGSSLAIEHIRISFLFWCIGNGGCAVTARTSMLCDILDDSIVCSQIDAYSWGKHEIAMCHIDAIFEFGYHNGLLFVFHRATKSTQSVKATSFL